MISTNNLLRTLLIQLKQNMEANTECSRNNSAAVSKSRRSVIQYLGEQWPEIKVP